MYCLSDKQVDFILNDIRARGVEMESLQQNLLDHICCIIEQNFEEKEDFENFYRRTVRTFYKDELWEIEEETIFLLTFKNYYYMKKIMMMSGTFAAITMSFGIWFKFMHWPGASILIVLGIVTSSLVFLPLLFTLKAREKETVKEKVIVGLGTLSGALMSLSILFRVMHWPGAYVMGISSVVILGLVFLPIYFFTGTRQPEKKVNTMTTSLLIIMGCGLWLTLIRSPKSSHMMDVRDTGNFLMTERLVQNEKKLAGKLALLDSVASNELTLSRSITGRCQELKDYIIRGATGQASIDDDFENKNQLLSDQSGFNPFVDPAVMTKVMELGKMIDDYNSLVERNKNGDLAKIPMRSFFIQHFRNHDYGLLTTTVILNQLSQVQIFVLQNERQLLAVK